MLQLSLFAEDLFDPQSVEHDDDAILDDYTKDRAIWLGVGPRSNEPEPNSLTLDCWVDTGWHIRRRHDVAGNPLMVWLTSDDAISTPKKWMIPSPNGTSQVLFCFSNPFPPIEVVIRTYDTLGAGPYAAIARATLRYFLS